MARIDRPGFQAPGPTGLAGLLARPGVRDLLLSIGPALLAQKNTPGLSLGSRLGNAIPGGIQALRGGQRRDALQNAFANAPPEMQKLLSALGPEAQQQFAFGQLQQATQPPPPPSEFTLGEGDVRFRGDEEIARGPDPEPNVPSDVLLLNHLNSLPEGERDDAIKTLRSLKSGTTVNIGDKPTPAEQINFDLDKIDLVDSQSAARAADESLAAITELERLLDEGVETGAVEDLLLPARRLGVALGIADADKLGAQEAFNAIATQSLVGATAALKGPISEKELNIIKGSVATLRNTPAGNRLILDVARRVAERKLEIQRAMREFFDEFGTLRGFEAVRRTIIDDGAFDNLTEREKPF